MTDELRAWSAGCLITAVVLWPGAPEERALAQSTMMRPTIYDDGRSCPNDCDAHVVFHRTHNGTANAFAPDSSRTSPAKCVAGQPCKICFAADEASCMVAMYRGNGPSRNRFDFTPAFFEERCSGPVLPKPFADMCRSAEPRVAELKALVNCIKQPEHDRCQSVIPAAAARKKADDALYLECKKLGEAAFNKQHNDEPAMQRTNDCAYEMLRTGKNSKGETWRRLLDGACRPGTYVGRDGLDCCTGSLFAAALLGSECRAFFVKP